MNRRRFFKAAVVAWAGSSFAFASPVSLALPRAQEPESRIAISSYPFRFSIIAPNNNRRDPAVSGMSVSQFGQFAQDRFGLGAVELLDKHFESTETSYLRKLRSTFARQHVTLVNIAFDNKAQLCSDDLAARDAGMTLHKEWIEHAVVLGCPSVRMRMPVGADPKILNVLAAQ